MKCPRCKNKEFQPNEEIKIPVKNLGNKIKYSTFDTRQYICLECGYVFLTKEEFYRDVTIKKKGFKNLINGINGN